MRRIYSLYSLDSESGSLGASFFAAADRDRRFSSNRRKPGLLAGTGGIALERLCTCKTRQAQWIGHIHPKESQVNDTISVPLSRSQTFKVYPCVWMTESLLDWLDLQ